MNCFLEAVCGLEQSGPFGYFNHRRQVEGPNNLHANLDVPPYNVTKTPFYVATLQNHETKNISTVSCVGKRRSSVEIVYLKNKP